MKFLLDVGIRVAYLTCPLAPGLRLAWPILRLLPTPNLPPSIISDQNRSKHIKSRTLVVCLEKQAYLCKAPSFGSHVGLGFVVVEHFWPAGTPVRAGEDWSCMVLNVKFGKSEK